MEYVTIYSGCYDGEHLCIEFERPLRLYDRLWSAICLHEAPRGEIYMCLPQEPERHVAAPLPILFLALHRILEPIVYREVWPNDFPWTRFALLGDEQKLLDTLQGGW